MNSDTKGSMVAPLSKYKLVFLGDQSVGKTSIINRFMFDTFDGKDHVLISNNFKPTVGIDFISKTLYYEDRTIRLQLWDTAGQERFRSLIPSYIRDSAVAVVCFDVEVKSSFLSVTKWVEDVRQERGNDVIIFLVANKIDIENRAIQTDEGINLAKELDAHFIEVSAKSGHNVEQLFKQIAATLPGTEVSQMMNSVVNNAVQNPNNNIQLDKPKTDDAEKKERRSCC